MGIIPKADVIKQMEELMSTFDLLEAQLSLRIVHTAKRKEESLIDCLEITNAHLTHMETRIKKHKEEGCWLQNAVHILALT